MRRPLLVPLALLLAACPPAEEEFVDADGDGYFANAPNEIDVDCDDLQPEINPAKTEVCNGVDDDCNGQIDDNAEGALLWYLDRDGDGFGVPLADDAITSCFRPRGYSGNKRDCNDADPFIYKGAQERCNGVDDDCDQDIDEGLDFGSDWFADRDRDGYGGGESQGNGCATDPTWVLNNDDCNDVLDSVRPDAPEICDGLDNDCDRRVDDADDDVEGARRWYADVDGDGYGDVLNSIVSCEVPAGFVTNSLDCNDDPANGGADQSPETIWFLDADRDGHGDPRTRWPHAQCWQPIGYSLDTLDCDDGDPRVWVGAAWHPDADRDGYGGPEVVGFGCASQPGWVLDDSDCDDRDAVKNPENAEVCNGLDDNCNGLVDDDDPEVQDRPLRYPDLDGDGYGRRLGSFPSCAAVPGTADNPDDCNDTQAALNPETVWYRDADRDTYGDPDNPYPTPQCELLPGYVLNTSDCDDTDAGLNDFTPWYTDRDQDGLGVGITAATRGCPTNPRLSRESGDCDDNDPTEASGGCFGPQVGLVEVTIIADADALGLGVLAECFGTPEALEFGLAASDANSTVVARFTQPEFRNCGVRLFNAAGDPSGDGYATAELRVCGTLVETFELSVPVQEYFPFEISACSGCYDPTATNFDPSVLVPLNELACIYE